MASIQALGNQQTYQVRLPKPQGPETASNAVVSKLRTAIPQAYPGARVDAGESVSGKVSEELAQNSAIAIALAMLGIAIYIWFRFEWQFGLGATISTLHDVVTTIGLFAIFQLEFNLTTLAAILTIAGYSINDTVVIYDRMRETLRKHRTMPFRELINLALNETLSRTILTVSTVALAVLALLVFGGEVLRGFSIAMLWGIAIGTYSSLFIAAPILYYVQPNRQSLATPADETGRAERASG